MKVFKVQAPDGTVIKVEAVDEATAIRGAQEHYASRRSGKPNKAKDAGKSFLSGVNETLGGIADTVLRTSPVGAVQQGIQTAAQLGNIFRGEGGAPKVVNPFSALGPAASRGGHKPETTEGEAMRTLGRHAPNAIAPGSAGARVANVFLPAAGEEVAGRIARAFGAGEREEAGARVAGGITGAGLASLRPGNLFRQEPPAGVVAGRARQDPNAMRQRAQQFRDAEIEPTLVDVVDDSGRGIIKAAASRASGGRQVANDFADARTLNMPDRIGRQARRHMSRDARTPDQIREQIGRQRSANADRAFGAVRNDPVDLGEEGLSTFRVPEVAEAIADAAKRERDPAVRGALIRLEQWSRSGSAPAQAPPLTVGMVDRISRVLLGKAQNTRDGDLAGTYRQFGELLRNPARMASPGYRAALQGYAADSRLQGAVDVGEGLMNPNTDEFVRAAGALDPRERALALAAGRRAIERRAGESVSAAPGIARKLADAPEQQARNAALMGDRAGRFQDAMRLEGQAVRNAGQIAPGRGSPSHLNFSDEARLEGGISVGRQIMRGDALGAAVNTGLNWLRSRGISDEQAEAIVRMATDPARTDEAIQIIAQRLGEGEARQFLQWRNAVLIGGIGVGTTGFREAPEGQQGP